MMRYRALSPAGDFTFGASQANYLVDSPAAVAQAVRTRLLLFAGEWFLDTSEGTPWLTQVLGTGTKPTYDRVIQERIRDTEGVLAITAYSSALDTSRRTLTVNVTVATIFGTASVGTLPILLPVGFAATETGAAGVSELSQQIIVG